LPQATTSAPPPAAPAAAHNPNEAWGSRIGLILAMAGNAVGLGNFLRFPGQAAANGGGTFMITYFIAFLLLGIPLMWIEWGIGRNAGRYRKGHVPGMFAAIWHHPLAKYLGVIGLVIPMVVLTYYVVLISWTLAFTWFSITGDYWGLQTQEAMAGYVRSYQVISDPGSHGFTVPFVFFFISMFITIYVLSRGISRGIEKFVKIGMPLLFLFAIVLAVAVFFLPPGPDGSTALTGFQFIFNPDFSRLGDVNVWLASTGQIFFTLSVGMGTLGTYASYLSTRDDITLSGLATAATNETAEVVLGASIAIPAAVTFFGVSGAMAVAQSGSFNIGFVSMPVIFQQMPAGRLLGALWFGLLFFAGLTSSVAMATPIVAFFREEFGARRETVAWSVGALALLLGVLTIFWFDYQFLWEWDYWAGTFGLAVMATIEVILFMWVFNPERAWASLHQGADFRIPRVFKFIMTYVTPLYLLVILGWWSVTQAFPILTLRGGAAAGGPITPGTELYIHLSRLLIVGFVVAGLLLIRAAWKRNGYDDRAGFREVEVPPARGMAR
jgi:SNF family Na+-dependent transporter